MSGFSASGGGPRRPDRRRRPLADRGGLADGGGLAGRGRLAATAGWRPVNPRFGDGGGRPRV